MLFRVAKLIYKNLIIKLLRLRDHSLIPGLSLTVNIYIYIYTAGKVLLLLVINCYYPYHTIKGSELQSS